MGRAPGLSGGLVRASWLDWNQRNPTAAGTPDRGEIAAMDMSLQAASDDRKSSAFDLREKAVATKTPNLSVFHLTIPGREKLATNGLGPHYAKRTTAKRKTLKSEEGSVA